MTTCNKSEEEPLNRGRKGSHCTQIGSSSISLQGQMGISGTAEGRDTCARAAVPAFGHETRSKSLRQNTCSLDGDSLHRKCLKLHVLVSSALA